MRNKNYKELDSISSSNSFYHGIVVNNDDPLNSKRVQVRITSKDSRINDKDLKWCINLNQSCIFMIPAIGEHVVVFLRNPWSHQRGRFYMGPIRSGDTAEVEPFIDTINTLGIEKNGL